MYDWAQLNGEPHWRSVLFPVSVDGMLIAASAVLYVDHRLNREPHKLAYWLEVAGVVVSISANVLHDWDHVVAQKWISGWGPIAWFGSFYLFVRFLRSLAPIALRLVAAPEPPANPAPIDRGEPAYSAPAPKVPTPPTMRPAAAVPSSPVRTAVTAPIAPPTTPKPAQEAIASPHMLEAVPAPEPTPEPAPATRPIPRPATPTDNAGQARARAHWDAERAQGRTPSGPELAELGGVDRRTGTRWRTKWLAE